MPLVGTRNLIPFFSLALLVAPAPAQTRYFSANLDGSQEVPSVATRAAGWATIQFNPASRRVDILVHSTGVTAVAAHLHVATRGTNGPVIVPLRGGPATWSGSGVLSVANAARLVNRGTYVNLHSARHRGGEIRGQVEVARVTRYAAILDGRQEVPANRSPATGLGEALYYEPDNVLTYEVNTQRLTNVVAAHIHMARRGQNGGVIHPLTGSNGKYCGSTVLSAARARALKANGLYFNVHTSRLRGGEIRGQILQFAGDFGARLDGRQENPAVITRALGAACVTLNANNTVTYVVNTAGLRGNAAHFHRGPVGRNGGVVIPLRGGPTVWKGTTRKLVRAELADLRGRMWYVNVHTTAHPSGEIRGQVLPATLPTAYGRGCAAKGRLAQVSATGFPCVGDTFAVHARNAVPNVRCELILGLSRSKSGPSTLPLHLRIIGMPDCFLLNDIVLRGLGARTDARGCATVSLPIPFDARLRDLDFYGQWLFLVPGANSAGGVVSNALQMRIQ